MPQALFQQWPIRNNERMERWYTRALALIKRGKNSEKKIWHTKKCCLLCEDLVPVSKNKLKVLKKVNLISVLYRESHPCLCPCLRRKLQPLIFVCKTQSCSLRHVLVPSISKLLSTLQLSSVLAFPECPWFYWHVPDVAWRNYASSNVIGWDHT